MKKGKLATGTKRKSRNSSTKTVIKRKSRVSKKQKITRMLALPLIVLLVSLILVGAKAFAAESNTTQSSVQTSDEDKSFIKILNEIIAKSYSPSMVIDGTITPGADCIADKGSIIRTNLLVSNEMLFNLSDEGEDPNYAMSMQVAKRGLILHLDTTIGDNCSYIINGRFFERKAGGDFDYSGSGVFSEVGVGKGQFAKAELELGFKIGFAGQIMHFRLRDIKSKLEKFQKGPGEEDFEYTFHGICAGDQELAKFEGSGAEITLVDNMSVKSPVTGWYELEKCEIHFADGQFRIPLKVSSKMPAQSKTTGPKKK